MFVDNRLEVKHPPALKVTQDTEIKSDILEAFDLNAMIDKENIDVSVINGIVTIKGEVDTYWKKEQAEAIISEIKGVKKIYNELNSVPTGKYTDKEIQKEIKSAIKRNKQVNAENVNMQVKNGEVTLSGIVRNWRALNAARDAARYSSGVIDLNNKLEVE
jgi:osmotically-inducible protein OsmY